MTRNERFRTRIAELADRPLTQPPALSLAAERVVVRKRHHCTVCGKPQEWSELEPGTGRCTECMP